MNYSSCDRNITYQCCDTQEEADSARCALYPTSDGCRQPDTTWTCTSKYNENNVVYSHVQKYIDGVASGSQNVVLGSCRNNGYCEGRYSASQLESDSCTYDSISTQQCRYGGQDGSACYYVCPDGKNHMCRMALAPGGSGALVMPECPNKPWKECADSIYRPKNPNKDYNPGTYNPPSDSLSTTPDDGVDDTSAETEILLAIRDTLHHANEQRKYQMYVEENMYDAVAGFGVNAGDGILQNIRNVNSNTRATQTATQNVVANTGKLNTQIDSLISLFQPQEDYPDTFSVRIVSPESLYVYQSSTPMVFRIDTTLEQTREILDSIRVLADTLVNDTPRVNRIMNRITPKLDSALSYFLNGGPGGYVKELAQSFADSLKSKIQPFYDFVDIDQEFLDSIYVELDSIDTFLGSEVPFPVGSPYNDTMGLVSFNPSLDSIKELFMQNPLMNQIFFKTDSIEAYMDSVVDVMRGDTIKDTLPLDEMVSDSALIRDKLKDVFLPDEILYECFDFHLNHTFRVTLWNKTYTWDYQLLIDFADLFGLDLCEFIRNVVKIMTFILIVFTTIKGYIRAFGGGDTL